MKKFVGLMSGLLFLSFILAGCGHASTSATKQAAPATAAPPPVKATATGQSVPKTVTPIMQGKGETMTPAKRPVPAPGRPLAKLSPAQRVNRWNESPAMQIDPDKIYVATIETDKGNIVTELYAKDAPQSVNNFVTLANLGFYDGLTFHRVEPGFVVQGGDPKGDGTGGPGYTVPAEIGKKHILGALAYARTGDQVNPQRRSSGSQFYITLAPTPFLDGAYTVFGQVIKGMDVVKAIRKGDKIKRIVISESAISQLPTPSPTPTAAPPKGPTPQAGRPLSTLPMAKKENLYNQPPQQVIDPSKHYEAILHTAKGDITATLWAKKATVAVNNFIVLANLGYYDNFPFNFVQENQFALTGSPSNRPSSDVGYGISATTGLTITTGTLGLWVTPATSDRPNLPSGSQFFIALTDMSQARDQFPAFGQVIDGMDIAKTLQSGDLIKQIEIVAKD